MRYLGTIVFLAITAAAAAFGAMYKPEPWYGALVKPAWTPPGWLFAPVWTGLYVMIAIAGWLVWHAKGVSTALYFWGAQMLLNAAWSWLMFGRHEIGLALADLAAMWLAIVGFIVTALPISRSAAALFVPYLTWVSFAGALNLAIWRLNG